MDIIFDQYKDIPALQIILECIVFFFGILSVYFAKKENIWLYPTGIISTIISAYMMFKAEYMADMSINIYYTIMSFYGWYVWNKKIDNVHIPISRVNYKDIMIGTLMFFLTFIFCIFIYAFNKIDLKWNNYIDIFTTSIFFTAMWFMALKKIENWILWIIGDILVIPIFCYRNLYIFAFQYLIFTILAVTAYIEWKKSLAKKI